MVLKSFIIGIVFVLFNSGLFEMYDKQVQKALSKGFEAPALTLRDLDNSSEEIKAIYSEQGLEGYVMLSSVSACSLSGCSVPASNKDQQYEYFDLLVLTDAEHVIRQLSILSYFSDYGYEITSRRYLKSFRGLNVCDFSKKMDGIDAISGATISSNALEGRLVRLCHEIAAVSK
jgi:hypothetical protein